MAGKSSKDTTASTHSSQSWEEEKYIPLYIATWARKRPNGMRIGFWHATQPHVCTDDRGAQTKKTSSSYNISSTSTTTTKWSLLLVWKRQIKIHWRSSSCLVTSHLGFYRAAVSRLFSVLCYWLTLGVSRHRSLLLQGILPLRRRKSQMEPNLWSGWLVGRQFGSRLVCRSTFGWTESLPEKLSKLAGKISTRIFTASPARNLY